jgi:hypothetical protein
MLRQSTQFILADILYRILECEKDLKILKKEFEVLRLVANPRMKICDKFVKSI